MYIRQSTFDDLTTLLEMFKAARKFMAQNGNPNQWVNRPTADDIRSDIRKGNSYVCVEAKQIVGTFAFIPGPDPTYAKIYNGAWPNDLPYGVIHRLAGSIGSHGIAHAAFTWAFTQCQQLRIDTHEDNLIMQRLLKAQGFSFCGTILLNDGHPRLAYAKQLS